MNVNIPPHPPTPRVRSINCCRKFTWTLTSHPTPPPPTPRVRSINCCRKFTWTLTSHPTPPPPPRVCVASTAAASSQRVRSINCCRKFTWTLTSHPTPPHPPIVFRFTQFQKPGQAYIYICSYLVTDIPCFTQDDLRFQFSQMWWYWGCPIAIKVISKLNDVDIRCLFCLVAKKMQDKSNSLEFPQYNQCHFLLQRRHNLSLSFHEFLAG